MERTFEKLYPRDEKKLGWILFESPYQFSELSLKALFHLLSSAVSLLSIFSSFIQTQLTELIEHIHS